MFKGRFEGALSNMVLRIGVLPMAMGVESNDVSRLFQPTLFCYSMISILEVCFLQLSWDILRFVMS